MIEWFRKKALTSTFVVKQKDFITPHYIRVVFQMTDQQVELFRNVKAGSHNKLFIPVSGTTVPRTYTTRHIDDVKKELWVDFVNHGDSGPASKWALNARPGDVLSIRMKEAGRPLFPDVDRYLFAGDSTALPVIATMLEQLPEKAEAKVILEVYDKSDEIKLTSKADFSVEWIYNQEPTLGSHLAKKVLQNVQPFNYGFIFVAAEWDIVRELKSFFRYELALPPHSTSTTSYWKRGLSEEASLFQRQQQRHS